MIFWMLVSEVMARRIFLMATGQMSAQEAADMVNEKAEAFVESISTGSFEPYTRRVAANVERLRA